MRIRPAETPLTVKLGPERLTLDIVTFELPAFDSVTLTVPLAPADTFPKLRLEALELSRAADATAEPLTATLTGEPEALLITESIPESEPTVFGEKTMFRFAWWPAAIVMGNEAPVTANPAVAMLAWVTMRSEPPPLDTVMDCEAVPFTATDPNVIDDGNTEMVAPAGML